MVGSICSRNCPCLTRSPSRTAILVIRPVMSAEMSTFFLGWILPLAVTAATRSRRPTFSKRTSWPRSRRAPALITTSPTIRAAAPAPTSHLLRVDMSFGSSRLPQRPADRRFERGQRFVIVVHRAHIVRLGAQRGHLGVEQLEERSRAHAIALGRELQHVVRRRPVGVLNRGRPVRRLQDQVCLSHLGLHLETARPYRLLQVLLLRLGLRHFSGCWKLPHRGMLTVSRAWNGCGVKWNA